MLVTLSTGHTSDPEWHAVQGQMEYLRSAAYVTRLRQDTGGSTYWAITPSGQRYLKALTSFQDAETIARLGSQVSTPANSTATATPERWEKLNPLGEGGQSRVFLVRSPLRATERRNASDAVLRSNPWAPYVGGNPTEISERVERLASSIWSYARPDQLPELGALKTFKIPKDETEAAEALGRLKNEITILQQDRPGFVKLLDANENERWIVTEFMPLGTLDKKPHLFKGNAYAALTAFRSLAAAVAGLHSDNCVHRDIKPANVFLGDDGNLILGDFGLVFLPEGGERITLTDERVGPRDYMPQWADLGERLEKVHTNFDVYMLGKLLWCMVAGRLKLPREYHNREQYDLKVLFPNDPNMVAVDAIVKKCVVEEPAECLTSARELLSLVDEYLAVIQNGGQPMNEGTPTFCRVCGRGRYKRMQLAPGVSGKPVVGLSMAGMPFQASIFKCDNCQHFQFFAS